MYILLPFTGGILAMLFYFVVRGGFFSPQSTIKQTSPFAFAAFASLVGMFSSQAVAKLKEIASTLLSPAQQGKDHISPAPTIVSISPASGPAAGSTSITVTGTNFTSGAKLTIGGTDAAISSVIPTSITATTPPHAVGKADVEVVNPDSQKSTLSDGFTYV
jgi:hypothetical protein